MNAFEAPKEEWTGEWGIPVPQSVKELPAGTDSKFTLTTWEYGQAAEILHVGAYSEETPTIDKLKQFITDSGYDIAGYHEEEYLKGPGMFWAGNPSKYLTLIRYPVKPKNE